jgi:hypothetical protein
MVKSFLCSSSTGYYSYIVSRPLFYDLLLKLVPAEKIHFGKRVLTISEKEERVKIHTADNCTYEGDILVGADGAYSAVRQRMYENLRQEGRLPKSDQEDLPFHSTCLVGQTTKIDFADFPEFQEPLCSFYNTMGKDSPHTVSARCLFICLFFYFSIAILLFSCCFELGNMVNGHEPSFISLYYLSHVYVLMTSSDFLPLPTFVNLYSFWT